MIEIKMPRLSDTMEEGAISTWHKQPGDTVAVGDVLVEIETDKAVMEYEAYQAGTLAEILVPEGQNADIGAPIALLDDGTGGPAPAAAAASAPSDSPERLQPTPVAPAVSAPRGRAPGCRRLPGNGRACRERNRQRNRATGPQRVASQIASPLVRKLARENHLDLSHVTGSGPGGRIIRADISGLLANGTPVPADARVRRRGSCGRSAVPADAPPPPAVPVTAPAPAPHPSRCRRRRRGPSRCGQRPTTTCAARAACRSARSAG